jgi:hypothetical protein
MKSSLLILISTSFAGDDSHFENRKEGAGGVEEEKGDFATSTGIEKVISDFGGHNTPR